MKYIHILLIAVLVVFQTACSDWLDVRPKSEVDQIDLFSGEDGYIDALHGIYLNLGKSEVYGDNLTMSFIDVLAQNYFIPSGSNYTDVAFYDFDNAVGEAKVSSIWGEMYNAIANCNNIIEHIEKADDAMFSGTNYSRIKGEAYALRAFLHFDLLRIFNAPIISNPDFIGIPYVDDFKVEVSDQLSTSVTIGRILEDLNMASSLLKNADEILSTEEEQNNVETYRENYINYYAVVALQARVNLYKGDFATALASANEVINAENFELMNPQEIVPNNDYTFYKEHIFCLFSLKIGESARIHFKDNSDDELICAERSAEWYEGDDIRHKYWFEIVSSSTGTGEKRFMVKYNRPSDEDEEKHYQDPIIPLIKLPEMYLIAAEATAQSDLSSGITLLNELKTNRITTPLEADTDMETFMIALKAEYEKEFYGEGQLFYFYKRMNYPVIEGADKSTIEMNDEKYTLPFPKNEVQFGGRENQ